MRIRNNFNNLASTYCSILTFCFHADVATIIWTQIVDQTAVDAGVLGGIPLLCSHKMIKIWNLPPPTLPPCLHLFDFGNPHPRPD